MVYLSLTSATTSDVHVKVPFQCHVLLHVQMSCPANTCSTSQPSHNSALHIVASDYTLHLTALGR